MRTARWLIASGLAVTMAGGLLAWRRLHDRVREALDAPDPARRPLQLAALPSAGPSPDHWGAAGVDGVVWTDTGLVAVGGGGVFGTNGDLGAGLPTLKGSAAALWRGRLIVALAQGGLFLREDGRWQELRSGWGRLHVRDLAETPAGELLIGGREGLFRAAWADATLARVDGRPVRSLAVAGSSVWAGGEEGLLRIDGTSARPIETADPWVEAVAADGGDLWVVTATGLLHGSVAERLEPVRGGEGVTGGVLNAGRFVALASSGDALLRFDERGRVAEEALPAPARRLFSVSGALYADTSKGLLQRTSAGWTQALPEPRGLPPGPSHVTALARFRERVVAGLFDGALLVGTPQSGGFEWREVKGAAAWGVNALLPAGGALWVASLRGAARFDGERLAKVEGPGAAFSLAATGDGVAIGYGAGVLLPEGRLLSAFHGLPGNQATALLPGPALVVGTPSGLGAIQARRVAWRATSAEGRLPHPWVTALATAKGSIYVGTYGGGVARRTPEGRYVPLVETEGFKVSAGALVEADGTLWLGTEGRGLFRLSADGSRFEPVRTWLPSPRVSAILPLDDALLLGTDEGLVRVRVEKE